VDRSRHGRQVRLDVLTPVELRQRREPGIGVGEELFPGVEEAPAGAMTGFSGRSPDRRRARSQWRTIDGRSMVAATGDDRAR
jgi:hypothetical protein